MEVVRRIKRASKQKRVGHGGTLDPIASGIVPICLGQATRMMEYLVNGTKEYHATIELGVETNTYDAEGDVTTRADASKVTMKAIKDALERFDGEIDQVPPMFSAIKKEGKRLYDLARAGIEVERQARKVKIMSVEVIDYSPPHLTLDVTCGRGFYMRSLAHDLGQALGCSGHLTQLSRTRSSVFNIDDALSVEEAEDHFTDDTWEEVLYAPDIVVRSMPAIVVNKSVEEMVRHGRPLPGALRIPVEDPDEECRMYSSDGTFLALVRFDQSAGQWRPSKVFAAS